MPDQIFTAGPLPTPLTYTVPGTGEVVPLACQAVYDGSGAGGSYIPAVIFRSQAGHVISRAILESTIPAGDDAEVSWFPGVKAGGSGAGATVAWGFTFGLAAAQVIAGDPSTGNTTVVNWDPAGFSDDGSGLFFIDPLAPAYIQCHASPQPGYFLVNAAFEHDNNTPSALVASDVRARLQTEAPTGAGPSLTQVAGLLSADNGVPSFPGAEFAWQVSSWAASRGDTTPIGFYLALENYNAGGADFNAVTVTFSVALVAA